jgi:hypothetical protein
MKKMEVKYKCETHHKDGLKLHDGCKNMLP